jgi:proline iminopeptidase
MNTLLRILALVIALAAATLAFVFTASPQFGFVLQAVLALGMFVAVGLTLLQVIEQRRDQPPRRTWRWLAGAAVLYVVVAQLVVGRAPTRVLEPVPTVPDVAEWTLDDSTRLAYVKVPATADSGRTTPVVVLHDGPGLPLLAFLTHAGRRPYDVLGAQGFDVYYYDQRGAGLSSRNDLRRQPAYSVAMHVADLEAVRQRIGAERLVLAGTGWGASLALQYLLAHPDRVERLLLESPGAMWPAAWPALIPATARARMTDVQASAFAALQRPPLRLVLGRMMADVSRPAAHAFIEDWEADQWWTRLLTESWRLGQPNLTCRDDPSQGIPPLRGAGFFANSYTLADAARLPDPRPALRAQRVDALIIRGSCDYVDWRVGMEYLEVLPGARYVAIPSAGHHTWLEQQALFEAVVTAFVRGEPVPLEVHHSAR